MAETTEGGNKEFVAFARGTRHWDDIKAGKHVVVRGAVFRSGESTFALALADGRVLDLDAAAVDRFTVVGTGLSPEIELLVSADALSAAKTIATKTLASDLGTATLAAQNQAKLAVKDIRTDPIVDKVPHKDIYTDPITDKPTFKDLVKDPITDPIGTLIQDQIGGTAVETLAEGGFDPGQVVTNPAAQAFGGATPFVMATPHHAPSPMVALQSGAAQGPSTAAYKPMPYDTLKELASDHTLKEVVKDVQLDTHKELLIDTRKEVFETTVEGGGTLQEGTGQIPGGFPGMPGF